jgi:hypothetical protein
VKKTDPLTITIDKDIRYSTFTNLPENINSGACCEEESAMVWALGDFLQTLITGDFIYWQYSVDGFKHALELAQTKMRVRSFSSFLIVESHKNSEW